MSYANAALHDDSVSNAIIMHAYTVCTPYGVGYTLKKVIGYHCSRKVLLKNTPWLVTLFTGYCKAKTCQEGQSVVSLSTNLLTAYMVMLVFHYAAHKCMLRSQIQ